jgi:hypothetical protein
MQKTTVYLEDSQVAALRRLARETGRSQAELIREAVGRATAQAGPRRFQSFGAGRGGGEAVGRNARSILREEFPRRQRR